MIDAVCIGDSIAVGLAPICAEVRAQVSAPSSKIINIAPGVYHKLCIISAGTNDPTNPKLMDNLKHIRNQTQCTWYVWVEPVNNIAASQVVVVANLHHDKTISFTPGPDGVHPYSYQQLAGRILALTGN